MPSEVDQVERCLRRATPRGLSPAAADRIASAMRDTSKQPRQTTRRWWLGLGMPAAAAAAAAAMLAVCTLNRGQQTNQQQQGHHAKAVSLSHVTIFPREDLGQFVAADGAPVEAFRYRLTSRNVWRSRDGSRSIETTVPLEAVVLVESQVY
jgi:hypothetical protein